VKTVHALDGAAIVTGTIDTNVKINVGRKEEKRRIEEVNKYRKDNKFSEELIPYFPLILRG
jgi:hypothetical protein